MTPAYTGLEPSVRKLLPQDPAGRRAGRPLAPAVQGRDQGVGLTAACSSRSWASPTSARSTATTSRTLRTYLEKVKAMDGPVLLHVLTNKGHGFEPAEEDPVKFHAPAPFQRRGRDHPAQDQQSRKAYTDAVSDGLFAAMQRDPKVAVHDGRDVRGEQAPEDPRHVPRPVLRRRASARATPSPSPPAWPRPAPGRSSISTARSSSARTTRSSRRSRSRTCRSSSARPRRPVGADGPTHHGDVRPGLHAGLPQHGRDGARRRRTIAPDARLRPGPRRARSRSATRRRTSRTIAERRAPIELGQAEILEWETDGMFWLARDALGTASGRRRRSATTGWASGWSTPGSSSRSTGDDAEGDRGGRRSS